MVVTVDAHGFIQTFAHEDILPECRTPRPSEASRLAALYPNATPAFLVPPATLELAPHGASS